MSSQPPRYERPRWTDVIQNPPDTVLGADIFWYLTESARWVHRRVEHISFVDDRSIRRYVSVDFTLPLNALPSQLRMEGDPLLFRGLQVQFVPVARLRKTPLVQFDICDEAGTAVPVLTRQQNGQVAWSLLVAVAEAVARRVGVATPLSQPLRSALRRVCYVRGTEAEACIDSWMNPIDELASDHSRLMQDDTFADFLQNLAYNFLLIAPIPHERARRRLLKFSYLEELDWPSYAWRTNLPWEPVTVDFEVPAIDESEAYHLEIAAPTGLELEEAEMMTFSGDTISADPDGGAVSHLYASRVASGTDGIAYVSLRPTATGLLRMSSLFATGVYLLLLVLFARLFELRGEAATALLLLLPSVGAAFIVRPGENSLTTRLLFSFRLVVTTIGLLPFVGAVVLVANFQGWALYWLWSATTLAAGILLYVVVKSYLSVRR